MKQIKVLYTAEATVTGGRDGHARSSDGRLELDLHAPNVRRKDATDLMLRADERCPYSNAIRGNVEASLSVDGAPLRSPAPV